MLLFLDGHLANVQNERSVCKDMDSRNHFRLLCNETEYFNVKVYKVSRKPGLNYCNYLLQLFGSEASISHGCISPYHKSFEF